ncbi:MAG: response regulator [Planctomycetes bacterium]|nr:response regulator [Planctomycetota bacterium]
MVAIREKTILVVDDEPDIRKTISRLMQTRGHGVLGAESGREALGILQTDVQVDLVILDILMPVMDGIETLQAIRRRGGRDLPVIMLTARTSDQDVLKGYGYGADYYITKPFKNERLLNIVDYLIGDLSDDEKALLEIRL